MAEGGGGLDLGKQVGPLPLGAWLAIVAGGLGLGYYINKRQKAPEPEPQLLAERGVGEGGGQFIYEPPTTGTTPAIEETNLTWGRKATDWLTSTGVDPYAADQAIRKYLQAEQLTIAEKAMVNLVLTRFGAPPEPLPPAEPTPAPTPTPTPVADTYAMHFTTSPRNPVGTRPWRLTGILLKNGKPTAGIVKVYYSRPTFSGWRPNGFAPALIANTWGNWVFAHPGLGADALFRFTWVDATGKALTFIQWQARVR